MSEPALTRTLTIALQPDWRGALRAAGRCGQAGSCQGETLNFETPGAFFGRLTELRWALIDALKGQGEMAVRELARRGGVPGCAVLEPATLVLVTAALFGLTALRRWKY